MKHIKNFELFENEEKEMAWPLEEEKTLGADIRPGLHTLYYGQGQGSLLHYHKEDKSFSIEDSSLGFSWDGRSPIQIVNPKTGKALVFSNPIPKKDGEGETTHWILKAEGGVSLNIWND